MGEFEPGDYVAVETPDGGLRCPVLRVKRVRTSGFTMLWPDGVETRWHDYKNDIACATWAKFDVDRLVLLAHTGSCFICEGGLISLALVAE